MNECFNLCYVWSLHFCWRTRSYLTKSRWCIHINSRRRGSICSEFSIEWLYARRSFSGACWRVNGNGPNTRGLLGFHRPIEHSNPSNHILSVWCFFYPENSCAILNSKFMLRAIARASWTAAWEVLENGWRFLILKVQRGRRAHWERFQKHRSRLFKSLK